MKKYFIPLFTLLLIKLPAQSIIVGFYNCENFYDTINQIKVIDEEFLPTSQKSYRISHIVQRFFLSTLHPNFRHQNA